MSLRRLLLWAVLGLLGLGMVAGIAAVLFPRRWVSEEIIITIFLTGGYTLGALVAVTVARKMRRLLIACLIITGVSWAGVTTAVWLDRVLNWRTIEWMFRMSVPLIFLSLAMIHRMILRPLVFRPMFGRVMHRVALMTAPITAAMLVVPFWLDVQFGFIEWFGQLVAVSVIVTIGSSLGAGVLWFFSRKPEHDEPGLLSEGVPVELSCPRCGGSVRGRSNHDCRCTGCRLRMRVEVEEPRCVCGYLLYQLVSETCPECGKAVPEADRWSAPASG